MNTQNNSSVNNYRKRMRAEGYARLEVTLGAWLITKARESARRSRWPLWKVVEDALIAYLKSDPAGGAGNAK